MPTSSKRGTTNSKATSPTKRSRDTTPPTKSKPKSKPKRLTEFVGFLTGSHYYGEPTKQSDIDLVIYCEPKLAKLLDEQIVKTEAPASAKDQQPLSYSVRFGKLNLILCTDPHDYQDWKDGTAALIARKPVTREDAVAVFKSLFTATRKWKKEKIDKH